MVRKVSPTSVTAVACLLFRRGMSALPRRHVDNLPIQQLQAVVGLEDAGLHHPFVLRPAESERGQSQHSAHLPTRGFVMVARLYPLTEWIGTIREGYGPGCAILPEIAARKGQGC